MIEGSVEEQAARLAQIIKIRGLAAGARLSGVLIIAEHRRGELRPVTLELVSAAQAARRAPADTVSGGAHRRVDREPLVPAVSVAGVDEIIAVKVAAQEFDPDTFEAVKRFDRGAPALTGAGTAQHRRL
jgi:hypothetical protein